MIRLALLVLVVGACTDSDGGFQRAEVVGAIDFARTGGIDGKGDGTALHIEPSGAVSRTSKTGAVEQLQLSSVRIDEIYDQVAEVGLTDAPRAYTNGADMYSYRIAAQTASGTGVVSVDDGASAPDAVARAIDTLRAVMTDEPGFAGRGRAAEWQRGVVDGK